VCVGEVTKNTHTAAIKLGQSPHQCSSNICDAKLAPEPETTTIRPGCQITFHALKRRGAERERERAALDGGGSVLICMAAIILILVSAEYIQHTHDEVAVSEAIIFPADRSAPL
jgi:hypothetical protein